LRFLINEKRGQLKKKFITLFIILFLGTVIVNANENITPNSLTLQVYSDGSTELRYVINPEPTKPRVNVSLFGDNYQDILVMDQDGLILNWKTFPNIIQIDSIGSTEITIAYDTTSLTNKTGTKWSVSITSPINVIYNLPTDAVLIGLSPTPLSITIIENQASITLPNGTSKISYLLGTTGTKERSIVLLNKAEETIQEIKLKGIKCDEAELLLEQARTELSQENYSQSEQYSEKSIETAQETETQALQAENSIKQAETLLVELSDKRNQEDLNKAENLLETARYSYSQGDYMTAKSQAEESYFIASTTSEEISTNTILMAATLVIVPVGALLLWRNQQKPHSINVPYEQSDVDIDKIFREHPHLRTDDKAVLRYIHESGGVFVTEIRKRFDIPKSSTWRMMKRLEEQGLIETNMVGRETHVQIKSR
jgi:uncharacterized membrane protein